MDGQLTDERSGRADGRTGSRTEETDGLTEITGGLTGADGQADRWTGEGRTGEAVDRRPREQEGGSGSRSVSERERQRRLQRDGSTSGRVAASRGLECAAIESAWWRVGEGAIGNMDEIGRASMLPIPLWGNR